MIAFPSNVRVWLAVGRTDLRRGMNGLTRKRPLRQPFPEHLPRERVIEPALTTCLCCGSAGLRKLGEDITETLEVACRS